MNAAAGPVRTGDIVAIRGDRWRVVSRSRCGDASIVEAAGCGDANRHARARFLLPFEPIEILPAPLQPRIVRPRQWRRIARDVLGRATSSWRSLRAAATADLTLIPFQLEPALSLIRGDACRFLIADGVGLGKTVQAGLIIAEVLARDRGARVLVVSPAALREQWRQELTARFGLEVEVFDAAGVARAAAGLPAGINPWALPSIVVSSIDYIKRPEVMRSLEPLTWDVVAFDEAHHLGGRSDRAAAAQAIGERARAVVLLTATPHSGDDTAFQKLCGIGDIGSAYPLALFRRTRADAGLAGRLKTRMCRVKPSPAEAAMHAAVVSYGRRAWAESSAGHRAGARLAMAVLGRRACSSAGSLARSLEKRLALLQGKAPDLAQLDLPFADVSQDDDEPAGWLGMPGLRHAGEERALLRRLLDLARAASVRESKLAWIRRFLRRTREPAIVFTEYRDTLHQLSTALADAGVVELHGGLTWNERVEALTRFTSGRARVLLATDAASEGLNLHQRCRLVINLELPWTPVRLDQRVGRVDRIGQSRTVHAIRLIAAATFEESIVARLASRADRIRGALEPMPDETVVAESVFATPSRPRRAVPIAGGVHLSLRREAIEEARGLGRAKAWLAAADPGRDGRAAMTRLPRRQAPRHEHLWVYRIAVVSSSNQVVWETLLCAQARSRGLLERSSQATRLMLRPGTLLQRLVEHASHTQINDLQDALRRPLALWTRRETDMIGVIRRQHARMSASVLQAGLFDRRSDRAAATRAAVLDAALSRCCSRLEDLRACTDLGVEGCELALAVTLE
jgi:superfamily II DNA or RNA helicase